MFTFRVQFAWRTVEGVRIICTTYVEALSYPRALTKAYNVDFGSIEREIQDQSTLERITITEVKTTRKERQ